LNTKVVVDSDAVLLTLSGTAESTAVDELTTAFAHVDTEATRSSLKKVIVNLRALEFATSSCLKVFASWLVSIPPDSYRAVFLSNPQHSWQRRSLGALAACMPGVVSVESSAG
jgi:hypothetical protein